LSVSGLANAAFTKGMSDEQVAAEIKLQLVAKKSQGLSEKASLDAIVAEAKAAEVSAVKLTTALIQANQSPAAVTTAVVKANPAEATNITKAAILAAPTAAREVANAAAIAAPSQAGQIIAAAASVAPGTESGVDSSTISTTATFMSESGFYVSSGIFSHYLAKRIEQYVGTGGAASPN